MSEPEELTKMRSWTTLQLLQQLADSRRHFETYCPHIGAPYDEEMSLRADTAFDELKRRLS